MPANSLLLQLDFAIDWLGDGEELDIEVRNLWSQHNLEGES